MSIDHVQQMVALLNDGAEPPVNTLQQFAIAETAVLAIGPEFHLAPEESYCPVSDIPDSVRGVGVHTIGEDEIWVTGDNGDSMFGFKLVRGGIMPTKQPSAPAYMNTPAQYYIWFNGVVLESTGYLPSLAAAKKFARARYDGPVEIECAYPPSFCDGKKHPTN